MAIFRFERIGKNIIWEIDDKKNRIVSKPFDYRNKITDKTLLKEIDEYLDSYCDDEDEGEEVSFRIATKLKRRVFTNDILMFEDVEVQDVYKILMYSDYADAVFWDDEGSCVGGTYGLHYFTFSIQLKEELDEWQNSFEAHCTTWDAENWHKYNARGIELASKVKNELGDLVELEYDKPYEDPSFKKSERIKI
ncbi:MAG: hypothetical protein QME58_03670 [Bacteroidota bacterium]|nr:hypothetical protein [Bacteroidota bacterium]